MTSPLPPSGSSVHVRPVIFGETWTDPNGATHLANENLVVLEFLIDGDTVATRTQTPEAAIALARLLVDAAGQCFNTDIDDTGRKLPALERLNRFNQAWTGK